MVRYIGNISLLLYCCCTPAVITESWDYHPRNPISRRADNPYISLTDPDSLPIRIGIDSYLHGYYDGMVKARNFKTDGCLIGGCSFGVLGIAAGRNAPQFLFGDPNQYSEATYISIAIASLVGGMASAFGSDYLANEMLNIPAPDPMVEDTLFRKGFIQGYRTTYKSKRLRNSLKGSAMAIVLMMIADYLTSVIVGVW